MRIDFLGLQAFLSIAERGSFQRAAAHLSLSQTAISHRMRKLEDELGLKLFARTTRWAIVVSVERKARAISSVLSPPTSFGNSRL